MSSHPSSPTYEMATVLFMDIVGYSLQTIDRQTEILSALQRIVKQSASFQQAHPNDELITIPTGDGMALVFLRDPVLPVKCAMDIALALRNHPEITLRMGLHAGPVCRHADIKEEVNIVGGGINTAQRVMDCGDAGHILLSRAVAEVLEQFSGWRESLQDLGIQEVKHNVRVHLYNLCKDGVGNPAIPNRISSAGKPHSRSVTTQVRPSRPSRWKWLGPIGAIAIVLAFAAYIVVMRTGIFSIPAAPKNPVSPTSTAVAIQSIPPDVMRVINEWADSTRSLDIPRHMAVYANSLEKFYTKHDVSKAVVADEIHTMFPQYSSFESMQLSKWSSRELSPDRVVADFDKQYKAIYKTGVPNEGIVRSELVLQHFPDGWKIVSESDTKVYWTNKARSAAGTPAPQPEAAQPSTPPANPSLPLDVFSETTTYHDPDSYIEFRYPSRLFRVETPIERNEVVRLRSNEGVMIAVSIVATDRDDALRAAYRLELETPGRQVSYKTGVRNGWYVVSGLEGSNLFYRRVISTRGHIASLTISHNKDIHPSFNPAVVVAQTFHAVEETR